MDNKPKEKMNRCRFSHPSMQDLGACHCVVDGWEDEKILSMFMIGLRSIFFNDPGMFTGIYW